MRHFLKLFENVITPEDVLPCPCVEDANLLHDAHTVLVMCLMRLAGNPCQNLAHVPGFQKNAKPKSFTPLSVSLPCSNKCARKQYPDSICFFFFFHSAGNTEVHFVHRKILPLSSHCG